MKIGQDNLSDTFLRRTWLVELRGDKKFLGELYDNFSFQELGKHKEPRFFLEAVYGQLFLHSPMFDWLTTPKQVLGEGERLLDLMNGILKLQVPGRPNDVVDVGGIFVEESSTRLRVPVLFSNAERRPASESSPVESCRLVELSNMDKNARTLLQLYGSRDLIWWTLLKMTEIIIIDLEAILDEEGIPPKEKIDHLQSTIQKHVLGENHPSMFHSDQDSVMEIPMPLIEARLIIHVLLDGWISWKMNQVPHEMALSSTE